MITRRLKVEAIPVYTPLRTKVFKFRNIWTPSNDIVDLVRVYYSNDITDLVRIYYPIDMIEDSDECPPT